MVSSKRQHILLIFLLTASTFGFHNVGRLLLRNVKYSAYYRPNLRKAHHIERVRREFAEDFMAEKRRSGLAFMPNSHADKSKLCVAVIVAPRQVSYLLQSVSSVLRGLDDDSEFFIYTSRSWEVMEAGPVKSDLAQLVDLGVEVVDASAVNSTSAMKCSNTINCVGQEKESADYANALRLCTNRITSGHVVIIEDDGYATNRLSWKLREAAQAINERTHSDAHSRDWLLLKLFVTSFWAGWMNETVDIFALVVVGFLTSSCILCLLRFTLCKDPFERATKLIIVGVYVWTWSSVGILLVNKQNTPFNPWYFPGLYRLDPGNVASTVGHLYPYTQALELSQFIAQRVDGSISSRYASLPVDLYVSVLLQPAQQTDRLMSKLSHNSLIGKYAELRKLDCYVTVPTLVEHLGVFSSLPWKALARKDFNENDLYSNYKSSTWFADDVPGTS